MQAKKHGYLVISLDLELYWGMFDKVTLEEYGAHILGERTAIPRMLEMFTTYGIHATWASVGMLMARNKHELLTLLPPPHLRPLYEDQTVSAYTHIETGAIGNDEQSDPYHFGPSLIKLILATDHQEIGNHTFSHYYCIDGKINDTAIFARDLEAHREIARTYGINAESIIFPRNQANAESLQTCLQYGITSYRGNENHFLYRGREESKQSLFIRGLRLLDHYINISGHHTYSLGDRKENEPHNIPSSRFLRPWSKALRMFEWLRLHRIKKSMTHAAKHGEVFHLWWHPHNFGINQTENFKNLNEILTHYKKLNERYGMKSASMQDITKIQNRSLPH